MVEYPSNGSTGQGYLSGSDGPGIVVIQEWWAQEWWGLVAHIIDVGDQFGSAKAMMAMQPKREAEGTSSAMGGDPRSPMPRPTTRRRGGEVLNFRVAVLPREAVGHV